MNNIKIKCEKCGSEISNNNISRHMIRHENHPETFNRSKQDNLTCQYCNKLCKNGRSLSCHERLCNKNPNQAISYKNNFNNKGKTAWNKGLTRETDDRLLKAKYTFQANKKAGMHKDTSGENNSNYKPGAIEKHRKTALQNILSGRVAPIGHSRAKHGWYKGIHCDSSWELAYLIYCFEHNISIIRNKSGFYYCYEGKTHFYFPDFYLSDIDTYVEIKGYLDARALTKQEQFSKHLITLYQKDLVDVLSYVESKYGKDFIKLYENIKK